MQEKDFYFREKCKYKAFRRVLLIKKMLKYEGINL